LDEFKGKGEEYWFNILDRRGPADCACKAADERHADLNGGKEPFRLFQEPLHAPCRCASRLCEMADAALPHGNQGDLDGSKEPVQKYEKGDQEDFKVCLKNN
jgi:hypothetical protein